MIWARFKSVGDVPIHLTLFAHLLHIDNFHHLVYDTLYASKIS